MSNSNILVRFADVGDLPKIVKIYNQAIEAGNATAHTKTFSVDDRMEWFKQFSTTSYPIYIIEFNDNVAGYGHLSAYRPGRKALDKTAEISFYLDYQFHRKGLGNVLIQHIMSDCKRVHKETLLAILYHTNQGSISLLKKAGFEEWGKFPNVIEQRGQRFDHVVYGISLQ